MHPALVDLAKRFDHLKTRSEILAAISDLEDSYEEMDELEQETATRLLEELARRLRHAPA